MLENTVDSPASPVDQLNHSLAAIYDGFIDPPDLRYFLSAAYLISRELLNLELAARAWLAGQTDPGPFKAALEQFTRNPTYTNTRWAVYTLASPQNPAGIAQSLNRLSAALPEDLL